MVSVEVSDIHERTFSVKTSVALCFIVVRYLCLLLHAGELCPLERLLTRHKFCSQFTFKRSLGRLKKKREKVNILH